MEAQRTMHVKSVATSLFTMAALLTGVPRLAEASPPDTQVVEYLIREVPDHPDSPVVFGAKVTLKSVDTNGTQVAWEATELVLMEIDSEGEATSVWVDASPSFAVWQGRWWVEHADPETPELSEFSMPPFIEGAATAEGGSGTALDYTFVGETCESCRGMFGGNVAALNYEFILVGEEIPLEAGEVEPVQIDDDDFPPFPKE
jgi:hypothetical protein